MRKRNLVLRLLAWMVLGLLLAGCGFRTPVETFGETTYRVRVQDALGTPYTSGVVVCFLQDGRRKATQEISASGIAEKVLPTGTYTVELMFTEPGAAGYCDSTNTVLSAANPELTLVLAHRATAAVPLFADCERTAYRVELGSTYVMLPEARNYFLFTPTQPGTYQFSVTDDSAAIGYYGTPHFVQSESVAQVVSNTVTVSVSADMIGTDGADTTVLVIGVDRGKGDACMLHIRRIGEPEHTLAQEPWSIYEKTVPLAPYMLPENAQLGEFDLTAASDAYTLVLNENDHFYHLHSADGPVVLVRLGVDSEYLACFKTILETSGVSEYFFDDTGAFVKKVSYSECLLVYIANMDTEQGVYPLTEDLKCIIQQRGAYVGWFDTGSSLYLFKDANGAPIPDINPEISWLFMCCYLVKG